LTPLETIRLDRACTFLEGRLPDDLSEELRARFEELWALHPETFHEITIHGRSVKTPRWQQAYGADYHYTGRVNRALPVPPLLEPLHEWARGIDARLNGVLLNWYDPASEHYIGKHRDSTVDLIEGSPIVTISLGGARTFRLRPWRGEGKRDFRAEHGTVFVMPYATNLAWTHEVPHFARDRGRRISVTLRAFRTRPSSPLP
jgi:alkylated DNA repair dioxygenase AlkB